MDGRFSAAMLACRKQAAGKAGMLEFLQSIAGTEQEDTMKYTFRILTMLSTLIYFQSPCLANSDLTVATITSTPDSHKSLIKLSDGTSFSVPLERLKPIAILRTPSNEPRFLMSGADCTECDMNISIYVLKPMDQSGLLPRSEYPGKLKDYETGKLVQKTRMFYGQCLTENDSVVWSMDYVGEDSKWHHQDSTMLMENDKLEVKELPKSRFKLKSVLEKVSSGVCKELNGIDGMTEP